MAELPLESRQKVGIEAAILPKKKFKKILPYGRKRRCIMHDKRGMARAGFRFPRYSEEDHAKYLRDRKAEIERNKTLLEILPACRISFGGDCKYKEYPESPKSLEGEYYRCKNTGSCPGVPVVKDRGGKFSQPDCDAPVEKYCILREVTEEGRYICTKMYRPRYRDSKCPLPSDKERKER
jgi:hypothetical protein